VTDPNEQRKLVTIVHTASPQERAAIVAALGELVDGFVSAVSDTVQKIDNDEPLTADEWAELRELEAEYWLGDDEDLERVECSGCDGSGLDPDGEGWRKDPCPYCGGQGYEWR